MDFRGNCISFDGPLAPGDYVLDFEFTLPNDLPASLEWADKKIEERPKARVKHTVKAICYSHSGRKIKYKQHIIVHSPPVEFVEHKYDENEVPIKECYCCFPA